MNIDPHEWKRFYSIDGRTEGRELTWWIGEGGVKTGIVNEGIGHQEKVGDDGGYGVQVTYKQTSKQQLNQQGQNN